MEYRDCQIHMGGFFMAGMDHNDEPYPLLPGFGHEDAVELGVFLTVIPYRKLLGAPVPPAIP